MGKCGHCKPFITEENAFCLSNAAGKTFPVPLTVGTRVKLGLKKDIILEKVLPHVGVFMKSNLL